MTMPASVHRRASFGFTIVELLVVMAILGVLAAAVMPLGESILRAQKERDLKQGLWEIRNAIDAYKREVDKGNIKVPAGSSGYPPTLSSLTAGVINQGQQSSGTSMYFLRQIPRDPFASVELPSEQTWKLRSYASPPENPAPGSDVFDVRSSANTMAMDGTKYADW